MPINTLPAGYVLRHPTADDAAEIVNLYNCNDNHFLTGESSTPAEMRAFMAEVELDANAWVVVAPDGQLAGYEDLIIDEQNARFEIDGTVHPDHWNQGIGSFLVAQAEARIDALRATFNFGDKTPTVGVQFIAKDKRAKALFERYELQKTDIVMKIRFSQPPPRPKQDGAIMIRAFVPGQDDRAVFAVYDRAFRSIPGYAERPVAYERWHEFSVRRAGFDPSLWFLAVENGEIIGICLCPHDREIGWIRNFAVLPEHRGRGVAMLLLQHAFHEWYRRGRPVVGLAVQGDNVPALRLYEKAGMQVESVYATYQRVLE